MTRSRKPLAVVCCAALGLVAACTSGSHQRSGSPARATAGSPSPSPIDSPVLNADSQGLDAVTGTARITASGMAPVNVGTAGGSPADLSVDAAGHVRVEAAMRGGGQALFSIAGPAALGSVSGDHVSVLLPAAGLLIDTQQGNACTVTYTRASETGLAGTASCDAENGSSRYTVRVAFVLQ